MEEFGGCSGSCSSCAGCGPMDMESLPVLTLTDENGKETTFEKLDVVVLEDGRSFLIVSEITENISEEVEIVIDTLTDKELQKEVYKRFLKQQGIEEVQE